MRTLYRNLLIAALVFAPLGVAAQTVDISALAAQIAALQAQIAAQQNAGQTTQNQGSGAHCVNLSRTLGKGDSGADVSELQNFLIDEGVLEEGKATGFFGTITETAVKDWQGSHGIEPLGIVGPRTRTAMACSGGSSTTSSTPLVSNQCPVVQKPANCANAIAVQLSGCTVGWQCTVAQIPQETFTASPLTGPVPLVVRFAGVVTSEDAGFCAGNFCAATLVFGDGQTGAVPLPKDESSTVTYEVYHTYVKGGPFVANLYQGVAGSGAPLVGNGITINPIAPIVASATVPTITASPNFGNAPLPVTISVGNIDSALNLSVEFGDGAFGSLQKTGNVYTATHTYIAGGSYTIKLRRVNNAGEPCISSTCQVLASTGLSVGGTQVAAAALVASPGTGLAPLSVSFFTNGGSQAFTGGVVLDFGDNTTEIICAPNVLCNQKTSTHTYNAAGSYVAQILGFSSAGTTVLKAVTVNVVTPQQSSLKVSPNSGTVPLAVTFTGNGGNQTFVNGAILKYGDDTTETFCAPNEICGEKTKTHTYADGSQYSAQLIGLGQATASTTLGSVVVTATGGPTKVKVTGPTGSWRKGDSVSLTWVVRGTKPTSGTITFDLYTQAGARIGSILSITNFQSGSATWKIPSSNDKGCTATQPNGLCGVNLTPGMYKIQAFVTGVASQPETFTEAAFEIKDELITPAQFTLNVAPSTVEVGKQLSIRYRVANPPFNGGVAMWLVKPNGEQVGVIDGKLEADSELTTYPWKAGDLLGTTTKAAAGIYHVLAKVYTPYTGNYAGNDVTVHASVLSLPFTLKEAGTGASCTVLTTNLAPGDTDATTNGDVTKLQTFLAQDSDIYPEGSITGFYGNATRRAVERYQSAHGIVSSGSPETNGYGAVGPSTRASIASDCGTKYLFRATPLSGRVPLKVTFTAKLSPTSGELYAVDFGDGSSAQVVATPNGDPASVAHTYAANGTFIAKLLVYPNCTAASCTNATPTTGGTVSVKVTNTTTPPPQTCAAITRQLSSEDTDATTGGDVSRLQQFLANDKTLYPEGLVTGFYGPATARAVARYQASKNLAQTGTVGPQTLAAIRCTPETGNNGIFSATPLSGATPLLVRFATDRNVQTGSYRVNFGDGTTQWLSASSTTHTYNSPGAYTAELVESVGNCFGLNGDALKICEIGNITVLATKTISVSSPATMSVAVSPASVARGADLGITWSTGNAPAGSVVRLEVYREGATEATGNSDQGLTSGSSQLPANGSFTWNIPTTDAISVDGGFGGYVMTPGTYHITAKLYSGSTCWGFCSGMPERTIHATGRTGSFTVTAAGTPSGGDTGGSKSGLIACSITSTAISHKLRINFANGSSRDYDFSASGEGTLNETKNDTFPAAPTSVNVFNIATFNGGLTASTVQLTGQTSSSISFRAEDSGIFADNDFNDLVCTISW